MTGSDFSRWPDPGWPWWILVVCAIVGFIAIIAGIGLGVVWIVNHVRCV
jgi:hypothetical protein